MENIQILQQIKSLIILYFDNMKFRIFIMPIELILLIKFSDSHLDLDKVKSKILYAILLFNYLYFFLFFSSYAELHGYKIISIYKWSITPIPKSQYNLEDGTLGFISIYKNHLDNLIYSTIYAISSEIYFDSITPAVLFLDKKKIIISAITLILCVITTMQLKYKLYLYTILAITAYGIALLLFCILLKIFSKAPAM